MSQLRITIVQSALHWENISANLKMFSEKISSVKEETDVIVLPEMFSTGYSMNANALAETMDGSAVHWMCKTAEEKKCVVTGSLIIKAENKFYNRLVWMQPDGVMKHYDKRHLFALAEEEKTYSAGKKNLIVEWKGWKICPLVCFDLRFPVWSRRTKQDDYDLLLYVANWPQRRIHAWKQLLIARAIENQSYVVGLNRVGDDGNEVYHSGDSAVIDYKGELMSHTKPDKENIETVSLEKQTLRDYRDQFPFADGADEFKISI